MSEAGIVVSLLYLLGSAALDFACWRLTAAPRGGAPVHAEHTSAFGWMQRAACLAGAASLLLLAGAGQIAQLNTVLGAAGAWLAAVVARARCDDASPLRAIPMVYCGLALVLLAYIVNGLLQSPGAAGDLRAMQGCAAGVLLQGAACRPPAGDRQARFPAQLFRCCVCSVSLAMLVSSLRIPDFASACVFPLVLASAACLAAVLGLLCERRLVPASWWRSDHAPAFLLAAVLAAGFFRAMVYSMLVGNHAAPDGSSYALSHLWWALLTGEALGGLALLMLQRSMPRLRSGGWRAARAPAAWLGLLMAAGCALATLCAGSLGALLSLLAALVLALPWIGLL